MSERDSILSGISEEIFNVRTKAFGPAGELPLTAEMLRERPSGDIFGMTQNAGMGWRASEVGRRQFLILSTQGGIRAEDAILRLACWRGRRRRNSSVWGFCPSRGFARTRATAVRKARQGCSTAWPIAMTQPPFSGG
jgi:hypothetical protein